MLFNNLKIAYRNLLRNKVYSLINISGLAIGMACTILLLIFINHELSFDKFHANKDKLYQVGLWDFHDNTKTASNHLPGKLIDLIKDKIPEVEYATNYNQEGERFLVEYAGQKQYEYVNYADPDFLRMFSFPLKQGNMETALNDPFSVILTEKTARRIFGEEDPVGKILKMENQYDIKVTAVVKDLPTNTDFNFSFLLPFELFKIRYDYWKQWEHLSQCGYIQLADNANMEVVNKKMEALYPNFISKETKTSVFIFPLIKRHLYWLDGSERGMERVRVLIYIALFILLIACFNFMNLSTARAAKRAKEIGLKKTVGASRFQLILQFLGESILVTFVSINFALILVRLFLPGFNNLIGEELQMNYWDWKFQAGLLVVLLITGFLAGAYPALYLTSYKPVLVMKGITQSGKRGGIFRKVLVVLQFSLTIGLLVATIIISLQIQFWMNKDLGLDKDNIIYVPLTGKMLEKREIIKRELNSDPSILSTSFAAHRPYWVGTSGTGAKWEGKDPLYDPTITYLGTDQDFLTTFKIDLIEGKYFNNNSTASDSNSVIINETFAKIISNESVLDKTVRIGRDLRIIGVTKDFHFMPTNYKIGPLVIYLHNTLR